jgi:hypothetical protein
MSCPYALDGGAPSVGKSTNWYDFVMAQRKPTTNHDELLTSPQAAALAGLQRTHFARLVREGKGPPHTTMPVGTTGKKHLVLIRRGDLMSWMAARQG